jgi:hypothetical protein
MASSSPRSDLIRMGAVLAALLAVTGVALLLTQGSSDGAGAERFKSVDGRITAIDQTGLVLQPAAGGPAQSFTIRPSDVRRLDIAHLQTHMAQGLPSRVFYEDDGAARYAVRVDDLRAP